MTGTDDEDAEREAAIEAGRLMFARPWVFRLGVVKLDQLPPADRIEVAFAGRSNVGKSSLLNALTGQNGLARTSNTPGRTQEINVFECESAGVRLIDMPGYGFAQAPKGKVDAWTRLIKQYLQGRPNLRRVFLLIDSRHGIKAVDKRIMDLLDTAAVSYQVVLTKADKIGAAALDEVTAEVSTELAKCPAAHPVILATSSEKGTGIAELRAAIAGLAD
ncbi:ribosome biogenesis GTP-binding protein YihA/YsxC [Microbaculum marinisediminis]|uniref:Probable GTP-binding protein EngB n=1 Tax=Microbaculum marinisediminis TaxID=2931392 RepID=A0AAW5QUZ8_9HYPH|nr:ribosome biogenesis GTP-binding protein YihA/YsxC [Microbaculum sp. A6E488]MCT8970812.1 ribosome biogenesis GTP-binding protein YihA/YsxC [Microbaculum sp. A6E488]